MAMAGLYYNVIAPTDSKFCSGSFRLPGVNRPWLDWEKKGHGSVDMVKAIKTSCDVYFYSLANSLGVDRIHDYLASYSFGLPTGIDIEGEKKATLPSTAWRRQAFKDKAMQTWYPGDTINVGIGQGFLTVTPIQLAHATAAMAMHGKRFQPRLVHAIRDSVSGVTREIEPIALEDAKSSDPKDWSVVINGMQEVVKPGGTAVVAFAGAPYTVAAKTGTAQAFSLAKGQKYNAAQLSKRLQDHALFIAFAPVEQPKIAVAIVVENGGHGGSTAAPIARRLFDFMLLPPDQLAAQEAKRAAKIEKEQATASASDE
jgi:penicillin-binding protein 2